MMEQSVQMLRDMTPEMASNACEAVRERGALDVWMTPALMKKGRPGVVLSVLTAHDKLDKCLSAVFLHTSSLGVRVSDVHRTKLLRESILVDTRFGVIPVKIGTASGKVLNIAPEFEACCDAAHQAGVPPKEVYDEATAAARRQMQNDKHLP